MRKDLGVQSHDGHLIEQHRHIAKEGRGGNALLLELCWKMARLNRKQLRSIFENSASTMMHITVAQTN
jgi:DNA-binding XRE family transcriptional regulator